MPKQPKNVHKNATTTPEMRAFIHESDLATAVLARLLKVSESTVRKWRKRSSTDDISHLPKQLNTTLSEAQQYAVVQLRLRLKLSLDELLNVCKTYINPNASRAGLQRCLKRHGVSRLSEMQDFDESTLDASYAQVAIEESLSHEVINSVVSPQAMSDFLNQMREQMGDAPTERLTTLDVIQVYLIKLPEILAAGPNSKTSLLMAHDLNSQWVYVDLYSDDDYQAAGRYLRHVLSQAPFPIRRVLVKNYNEFLSRFRLLEDKSNDENLTENASKS
ncbi:transcriptional regulator [Psychromonas sp. psych-6C06]|uniref:helix-turn-helix domain-containing protein n=1 Tax=Psychromonas sp. psych-6C06 TaxID=2058089 RepID=UPI000C33F4A4|nr:helix-turn-helix domain-containing protein [Psychromonas sp. psych-6C06]PKF61118.1 transcriptional regulator [Psychromonas sp. psych-6C06]